MLKAIPKKAREQQLSKHESARNKEVNPKLLCRISKHINKEQKRSLASVVDCVLVVESVVPKLESKAASVGFNLLRPLVDNQNNPCKLRLTSKMDGQEKV